MCELPVFGLLRSTVGFSKCISSMLFPVRFVIDWCSLCFVFRWKFGQKSANQSEKKSMAEYEQFITGCFPSIDQEIVHYVNGRFLP